MANPSLIDTLEKFINTDNDFIEAHKGQSENPRMNDTDYSHFKDFLRSTLDEVRINEAGICTKAILEMTDIDDADFFRVGLLRREITGEISYQKQRDHFA
ncbi:MAG: hypothetical protein EPO24_07045, partial [Bacteroidetes bacterium]